jgi:predicted PurR-regulated permease PerM
MVLVFLLFGYAIQFFLLVFGAILFAVMLRAGTNFLKDKLHIPDGLGVAISSLVFIGILIGIFILISPRVSQQVVEMRETLPAALEDVRQNLEQYEWGRIIIEGLEGDKALEDKGETKANDDDEEGVGGMLPDRNQLMEKAGGFFSSTLAIISDLLILLVLGIFFAISPRLYVQGVVVLVSPKFRPRLEGLLYKLYHVLKSWLLGKLLTMLFVGVASTILLIVLGVPLAFALGFIAFLLDFIPTIGPIIAAIPAILVAFLKGPSTALWVALGYFVIQSIESYVLVPIIYKKTVSISPVITLGSLVLFGILAGPLGVILATPLVAAMQVIIKELYIKDYLEQDLPEESENSFESRMGDVG